MNDMTEFYSKYKVLKTPSNYIAIIPAGIVAVSIYAPVMNSISYPNGEGAYELLSNMCHQDFFRSFSINGHPCGLCARCLGGYLGVIAGLLSINVKKKINPITMLWFYSIGSTLLILAIVDALVKFGDSNIYRLISGGAGGLGFGLMLMVLSSFYLAKRK